MDKTDSDRLSVFVSAWEPIPARLSSDTIICAVGDVHGHLSHLSSMIDWLTVNVLFRPTQSRHLILLGDYIDRGLEGIGVLSYLGALDLPGVTVTKLRGNHDMYLDTFLHDPECDFELIDGWMSDGGNRTLFELGLHYEDFVGHDIGVLRERVLRDIPAAALRCLEDLQLSARVGNYVFVHAGVHPDRPLDLNDVETLTTLREPFLSAKNWQHDFVVVHGHTVCGPDVRQHRISCDSGVYYTGVLTCAQIEETGMRFIAVTPASDLNDLDRIRNRRGRIAEKWVQVQ